jgi:hypothetical protein
MTGRLLPTCSVAPSRPSGPVVLALDGTIERRWGRRIKARGISRQKRTYSRSVKSGVDTLFYNAEIAKLCFEHLSMRSARA